jgi:hypothetical protein
VSRHTLNKYIKYINVSLKHNIDYRYSQDCSENFRKYYTHGRDDVNGMVLMRDVDRPRTHGYSRILYLSG